MYSKKKNEGTKNNNYIEKRNLWEKTGDEIIEMKMIILIREKLHKLDNLSSF